MAAVATGTLALGPPALGGPPPAAASDVGKVGACLLSKCQAALGRCLGDPECLADLVCLQLCNGAEDETACQARCSAGVSRNS